MRRLLVASLCGRIAFSMLPLGFVLFATGETGSNTTAGVLVAAFTLASALMPVRGRIVDRHGGVALGLFACACSSLLAALVAAAALGAPPFVLVIIGGLAGLVLPPLGPFTRAAWSASLQDGTLQRAFALDSAGEEGALIVAPLLVSAAVALYSPRAALLVAAAGLLVGTVAAGRSSLAAEVAPPPVRARAPAQRLPGVLWLMMLALAGTAAALGAIDVAVPAAARAQGEVAAAGLLLSGMAVGTMAGSLLAGPRQWTWPAEHRVIVLQLVMGAGIAGAALAASHLWALGLVLLIPAAILGVLFTTLYVLVDRLSPEGSRTQTFAWLVTANNGGIGVGAALGGALTQSSGAGAGLWFGAICAFLGVIPAVVAAGRSVHGPNPPQTGGMTGVGSDKRRINQPQGNGESGEGP